MSNSSIKTEMKGTTSRWMRRADAKDLSRVQRRVNDTAAVQEGVDEVDEARDELIEDWMDGFEEWFEAMTKTDLKMGLGAILALINEMMGLSFSLKERTYEIPWMEGGDSFCIKKTGFELRRYFPPQDSGVGIIPCKGNKKFVICVENGEGEIDYISEPIKGRTRTCCRVLAVITEIELMGLPYRKD